jgi:large subunit ribosomal protein L15
MSDKTITLSNLSPARGSTQSRKRVGGGQMPMYRRLPKRGFTNPFKVIAQAVNLADLKKVGATEVTPETLYSAGLIGKVDAPVKLLGTGDADRAYTVRGVKLSASARTKIEAAGGSIEG